MHAVYLDGVFDLFHASHLEFIKKVRQDAMKFFELNEYDIQVVVGVISDSDTESYKRTPVWNLSQRTRMLEQCKLVDKVVPGSPLHITKKFLDAHQIQLVYHADDSPQSEFFKVPINLGMMRYVPYDPELSTTAIIQKIKNEY